LVYPSYEEFVRLSLTGKMVPVAMKVAGDVETVA